MTTTTDPMPTTRESTALSDGTLVPALLQAVRDQAIDPRDAHFAFPLAVPMVAARLGLSSRSILVVTESGEALYGPGGQTIAEICEEEATPIAVVEERDVVDPDSGAHDRFLAVVCRECDADVPFPSWAGSSAAVELARHLGGEHTPQV